MKKRQKSVLVFIALTLMLASLVCNMPRVEDGEDADSVNTQAAIQLTQTAVATVPTEAPTATFAWTPAPPTVASPQTGSISGKLSYPSEWIPAQRVVAFQVGSEYYYYVETAENQGTYQITDLPPGAYHVVAYLIDGELSAGYTHAVPCGLSVDCNDHSLIDVQVATGSDASNIDPGDWYAPPGSFPPDPLKPPPSADAPSANSGNISGNLSYPSEYIPPLVVVAFHQDSSAFYYVETAPNQKTYQIKDLPSGIYHIVAYLKGEGFAGGYTQAVLCGLTVDCNDHSLIPVMVHPGQETSGADPKDWYAPGGAFPPMPLQ